MLGFPGGTHGKESACNAGKLGSIPGLGDPLEEGMATHSSIRAWRIPWTEDPGSGHKELDMTTQLTFQFSLKMPESLLKLVEYNDCTHCTDEETESQVSGSMRSPKKLAAEHQTPGLLALTV